MQRNMRKLSRVLMIVCTLSFAVPASQMYAWGPTQWICNRAQEMYSDIGYLAFCYKSLLKRAFYFGAGALTSFMVSRYWNKRSQEGIQKAHKADREAQKDFILRCKNSISATYPYRKNDLNGIIVALKKVTESLQKAIDDLSTNATVDNAHMCEKQEDSFILMLRRIRIYVNIHGLQNQYKAICEACVKLCNYYEAVKYTNLVTKALLSGQPTDHIVSADMNGLFQNIFTVCSSYSLEEMSKLQSF